MAKAKMAKAQWRKKISGEDGMKAKARHIGEGGLSNEILISNEIYLKAYFERNINIENIYSMVEKHSSCIAA